MHYYFYFTCGFSLQVFAISFYPPLQENETEIRIGFLSSYKDGDGKSNLVAGAVTLAVEYVNSRSEFLPGRVLRFTASKSGKPHSPVAIKKMTEMREHDVVAFIGPDNSCDCEALTAAAWNLPMLAFKCSDLKVSNKELYPTFARTHPPSPKVSKTVISLLLHFNWTTIMLVVTEEPFNLQVEESLYALVRDHGIVINKTHHLPRNYRKIHQSNLTAIIDDSYEKTRIYVLLADRYALVDFVRHMKSRDLLDDGDYMIIYVESEVLHDPKVPYQFMVKEFEVPYFNKSSVDQAPYRSVLVVTPTYSINSTDFEEKVRFYSGQPPFNIPFLDFIRVPVSYHAYLLYDAILLYAKAVTLQESESIEDGIEIFKHINATTYDSILGSQIFMDENGDAEGNYTLLALQPYDTIYSMQPVGLFAYQTGETHGGLPILELEKTINWVNGEPPRAVPTCGFENEYCTSEADWRHILIYSLCLVVVIAIAALAIRRYRYEHKLARLLWKIDAKDLVPIGPSSWQNIRDKDEDDDEDESVVLSEGQELIPSTGRHSRHILGLYKGNVVCIKPIFKKSIDLTRSLRKEMIQIREMRHENINSFVGACVDSPNICTVFLNCARGSLKDILKNPDIKLDSMFIASFMADLIKGMTYIHESEIVSHGNLKTSNCLVDSRWTLQVADFGLHEFKAGRRISAKEQQKRRKGLLWTAPELLRLPDPPLRGTQKGDVYSFAIILHEVLGRKGPWGPRTMSHNVLIDRVMRPERNGDQLVRPPITAELTSRWPESVFRCLKECWREVPASRPDFRSINVKLREMLSEVKTNIVDNAVTKLEKYASDLEGLVQERTKLLMEEKKKTENLLLRMLPKPVAEQLKRGENVEAESFDCVTIYFSDIVGFTEFAAGSTPLQVVDLLNKLYTCFDSIIGDFDVYKVETIGDAYMVVSGLPIRNGDRHAAQIAYMALRLLDAIRRFEIRHRPGDRPKLRIGIHSGPCVAGVVGLKMPRYCLFGDTVNTASRMQTTGEALKIHISHSYKEILDKFGEFDIEERGLVQIKGKGEMRTYWLTGQSSRLSDDAKLRRHTDSKLEIRFAQRFQSSQDSKRAASGADQWQWPTAIGPNTTEVSSNSCRDLQTRKNPKNWGFIPNVQIRNCRFEPMQTDEPMG